MDSATFDPTLSPFNQGTDVSSSPSFNFGNLSKVIDNDPTSLTYNQFLYMQGQYFYYVLMIASTSGRRYIITESGTQLAAGSAKIANESVVLAPGYQWDDKLGGVPQLGPPTGAYVGPVAAATSTTGTTQATVYQSDPGGLGRVVRAVVAISGPAKGTPAGRGPFNTSLGTNGTTLMGTPQYFDAWKAITPDQPSGSYNGTITFTLTLN
jgi:hypothetical protein